jgi:hypothetical protein
MANGPRDRGKAEELMDTVSIIDDRQLSSMHMNRPFKSKKLRKLFENDETRGPCPPI